MENALCLLNTVVVWGGWVGGVWGQRGHQWEEGGGCGSVTRRRLCTWSAPMRSMLLSTGPSRTPRISLLLLQPRQNQCLNHLLEKEGKAGVWGSPQGLPGREAVAHSDLLNPSPGLPCPGPNIVSQLRQACDGAVARCPWGLLIHPTL